MSLAVFVWLVTSVLMDFGKPSVKARMGVRPFMPQCSFCPILVQEKMKSLLEKRFEHILGEGFEHIARCFLLFLFNVPQ